jgi:SAM-dependent methyltransferase
MCHCANIVAAGNTAIDVGTGCGVLALLFARQGARSIGVDPNPRAPDFVALNARLNDLPPPETLIADHQYLAQVKDADAIVFAMPLPSYDTDIIASGFRDEARGWRTMREFYASAHDALSPRGIAALRHEIPNEVLNEKDFLDFTHAPDEVQIAFLYIDPEDPKYRAEIAGMPPQWSKFTWGHALIRRRHDPRAPRVSFATFSFAESLNYSARLHWRRVLSMRGWHDVFDAR